VLSYFSLLTHVTSPGPRYLLRLNILAKIFERYIDDSCAAIMEVGAGTGDISAFLARELPKSQVTVVESSGYAAVKLQERFSSFPNIELKLQRLDQMRQSSSSFDLALAFEVLEHIENDVALLNDIKGKLTAGGYLILSVPAYMSKWQTQDVASGHIRRYEELELRSKLKNTVELIDYGFPLTSLMRPVREIFYRDKGQNDDQDMSTETISDKTALSGIGNRLLSAKYTFLVSAILTPFFLLQVMFKQFRLGDGFVVVAQKTDSDITLCVSEETE